MARISSHQHSFITSLNFIIVVFLQGVMAAKFTFINKCDYTVWPGILANPGSPRLESAGFELTKDTSRSFQAPSGWTGRFWGRTACNFDDSGRGSCATTDCGSGEIECNGGGAIPPATLAEFTLGSGSQDFYDVSLVDGYNLPMIVEGSGGSGECATTGCLTDLNKKCPSELRIDNGAACKSACDVFGKPEYCCSGAYNSPGACKPSMYSQVFKSACPKSYSYAFDDATSTFTCSGADYICHHFLSQCPEFEIFKGSCFSNRNRVGSFSGSHADICTSKPVASKFGHRRVHTQPIFFSQYGFAFTYCPLFFIVVFKFSNNNKENSRRNRDCKV